MRGELQLAWSAGGIYFFYVYYGVLQERIYRPDPVDGARFSHTLFLLLAQCAANMALGAAASLLLDGGRPTGTALSGPAKRSVAGVRLSGHALLALLAATYLAAMGCSNVALQFVSYPFQALAKSCKMVPVMLFNVLLGGAHYGPTEYLAVALITLGVIGFQSAKAQAGGLGLADSSASGMALLLGSLCLDGVTGSLQKLFTSEFRPTPYALMAGMNLCSVAYLLPLALLSGEAWEAADFLAARPQVLRDLAAFSLCSALGQLFIFYSVVHLGPLATTTITTTRKFFTVLLSVLMYPDNALNGGQWAAVGAVFAGLSLELLNKYRPEAPADAAKKRD